MAIRTNRLVILSAIVILLTLLVLDITFNRAAMIEAFGEQFTNEERTMSEHEAKRSAEATAHGQVEADRQGIKEVRLSDMDGNIAVKRATGDTISMQYTVSATGKDQTTAKEKADGIQVEKVFEDGSLAFQATAAGKPIESSGVIVEYVLLIPDDLKLTVDSEDEAVNIRGLNADVDVHMSQGTLEVVDVQGNLTVRSEYANLMLSDITGDVDLQNRGGNANIAYAKGDVTFSSRSGQNFLSHIEGDVKGSAENGGSLHLHEITGAVTITSREADVQLDRIRNDIQLKSEYGQTTLILPESEGYALDVKARDSSIQTHLPYPIDKDESGDNAHMQGTIGDGTWKASVEVIGTELVIH